MFQEFYKGFFNTLLVKLVLKFQQMPEGMLVRADVRLVAWFRWLFLTLSLFLGMTFVGSLLGVPTSNNLWKFVVVMLFGGLQLIGGSAVESECEQTSEHFWSSVANEHRQVRITDTANEEWLARYFVWILLPGLGLCLIVVALVSRWSSLAVALTMLAVPAVVHNLLETVHDEDPLSAFKSRLARPFMLLSFLGPLTLFVLGALERVYRTGFMGLPEIDLSDLSSGIAGWWGYLLTPVVLQAGDSSLSDTYARTIGDRSGFLSLPGLILFVFLVGVVAGLLFWREDMLKTGPRWRQLWGSSAARFGELTDAAHRKIIFSARRQILVAALWLSSLVGWLLMVLIVVAVLMPPERIPAVLHRVGFMTDSVSAASWVKASSFVDFGGKTWVGTAILIGLISPVLYLVISSLLGVVRRLIAPHLFAAVSRTNDTELLEHGRSIAAQLGIKPPRIVERQDAQQIYTTQLLPFLKPVIVFPSDLVPLLTTPEKEALLFHEFYHIQEDMGMMSWLTVMSTIVPFGGSLLTLGVDLVTRELRADEFAVAHMETDIPLRTALEITEKNQAFAEFEAARMRTKADASRWLDHLKSSFFGGKGLSRYGEIHSVVFAEPLVGYAHPTISERIEYLRLALPKQSA